MRCNVCGKDFSAGEGEDTILGFVCRDCFNARDFKLCAECGRKFPRDEMVEWNGLFYCRSDYFRARERLERIKEEERKKKEEEEKKKQPSIIRPGSGIGIPIRKKKSGGLGKDEINSLMGKLNENNAESRREIKETKRHGTETKSKEDLASLLNYLSSKPLEAATDVVIEPLGDVSSSASSRARRHDAPRDALDELNELLRGKRKKD